MNPAHTTHRIDERLHALSRSSFRRRFRLNPRDRAYYERLGATTTRAHAERFVASRLAPAEPRNDGRQTPMRHHPVFVAQHATASCCRACLAKWHGIAIGRALTETEQAYVRDLVMAWLAREQPTVGETEGPRQRTLF